jgi:hypothetical protein
MRERRRLVTGVMVVALTVTALGFATLGPSGGSGATAGGPPVPTLPPHHVLALGDSVAAGFGLRDPGAGA